MKILINGANDQMLVYYLYSIRIINKLYIIITKSKPKQTKNVQLIISPLILGFDF